MSNRNQSTDRNTSPGVDRANKGRGMQGVDKAPGEEPAQSTEKFVTQTQKGKNKVDGDPSKPSDQPIGRQDIGT